MAARGPAKGSPAAKRCASTRMRAKSDAQAAVMPVSSGRPVRPLWLTGEAAAEWDQIILELEEARALAKIDRAILAGYCQAWSELIHATAAIEQDGRVVKEPIQNAAGVIIGHKFKAHPATRQQQAALDRVLRFAAEFGLSPASRSRIDAEQLRPVVVKAAAVNRLTELKERVEKARNSGV